MIDEAVRGRPAMISPVRSVRELGAATGRRADAG